MEDVPLLEKLLLSWLITHMGHIIEKVGVAFSPSYAPRLYQPLLPLCVVVSEQDDPAQHGDRVQPHPPALSSCSTLPL